MTLLKSCQERVSDEIDHEVDEALAAADSSLIASNWKLLKSLTPGLAMAG
jgi:hypothetical protein